MPRRSCRWNAPPGWSALPAAWGRVVGLIAGTLVVHHASAARRFSSPRRSPFPRSGCSRSWFWPSSHHDQTVVRPRPCCSCSSCSLAHGVGRGWAGRGRTGNTASCAVLERSAAGLGGCGQGTSARLRGRSACPGGPGCTGAARGKRAGCPAAVGPDRTRLRTHRLPGHRRSRSRRARGLCARWPVAPGPQGARKVRGSA